MSGMKVTETKATGYLMNLLAELGYDHAFTDEAGNVIGLIRGRSGGNSILSISHLVKECLSNESSDEVENKGAVIGDKTISDSLRNGSRASLAAHLLAGAIVKKSKIPLDGDIIVATTVARDGGLNLGLETLMDDTLSSLECWPDFAVIAAPTGLRIILSHSGRTDMEINVIGDNPYGVNEAAHAIAKDLQRIRLCAVNSKHNEHVTVESPIVFVREIQPRATIRLSMGVQIFENIHDISRKIEERVSLLAESFTGISAQSTMQKGKYQLHTGKVVTAMHAVEPWCLDPRDARLNHIIESMMDNSCSSSTGEGELELPCAHMANSVMVNRYKIPTLCYGPDQSNLALLPTEKARTTQLGKALLGMAILIYDVAGAPVLEWKA